MDIGEGVAQGIGPLLRRCWKERRYVCVGLDSDLDRIPPAVRNGSVRHSLVAFNKHIIDATQGSVCAFKPNTAFYERHGHEGIDALIETVQYIKATFPDIAVILDAKRGDIGSSSAGYAAAAFDLIGADAITVHPYLGGESLTPFLERPERGVFVLVKTSNPSAGEFQDLPVGPHGRPLFEIVADRVRTAWNTNGNCGVVVGARYPESIGAVRDIIGDLPMLIPGVGAQGGSLSESVTAGRDRQGSSILVSSSRDIIFASDGADFATAAGLAAARLNHEILSYLDS